MVSLGKFRHMSQCSTADGHFVILAIDHRANLREALSAARGIPVDDKEVGEFKRDVVRALGDLCSGVLGDPAFVLGYGIASGLLRGTQGLIAPVEVTNYALHPSDREVQFIPGWNVEKAKRVGLNGMKLLLYFHPDAPTASQRIRLAQMLADVCNRYDIPLFVEPVLHQLKSRSAMTSDERIHASVDMARKMAEAGADILKLEFPVDVTVESDEYLWENALNAVNAACGDVPWVLLSGGMEAAVFARQAEFACKAGSSGVMAGRALWNPAVKAGAGGADSRISALQTRARRELDHLANIVKAHAVPFWEKTGRPVVGLNWYEDYSGFNGAK
jgi:tagatose 1,6-diphosphate aldolase